MAYNTKTNPKVAVIANKILDILEVALNPFHEDSKSGEFDVGKLKNVSYIADLLKTVNSLSDENVSEYSNMSDDEIKEKLLALVPPLKKTCK